MSLRVYGYCDAGCRRRVPSYEEFESIATYVKVLPEKNGEYKLDATKTYLIKNPSATDDWGFTIKAITPAGGSSSVVYPVELITYDRFADGLKFRFLKIYEYGYDSILKTSKYNTKHEQNGTVSSTVFQLGSSTSGGYKGYIEVKSTSSEVVDGTTIYGELDIIMYNEDVEVVIRGEAGLNAYELAKESGVFTGTLAEYLRSLQGAKGEPGLSAFELAQKAGYKGTEAQWLDSLHANSYEHHITLETDYENPYSGNKISFKANLLLYSRSANEFVNIEEIGDCLKYAIIEHVDINGSYYIPAYLKYEYGLLEVHYHTSLNNMGYEELDATSMVTFTDMVRLARY